MDSTTVAYLVGCAVVVGGLALVVGVFEISRIWRNREVYDE